ncbi:ABC transporter ATP-binding protein/permease [Streptomyces chryseus]|uniref:ABC transporter ATP-binding protein/permease n=3 Tax=Streptomyces chryseus TaxID=68186 RepID=UPI001B87BD81|nr:ATP-binding cassette domain-containing protein [Streptomyces chryseus]
MPSSVMPTSRQAGGHASPAAVSTLGLRKSYGDRTVLDGIDLRIPAGSVFALLGPNGAGKTTVVKILSTLIGADGGQAQVAGHDLATDPQAVRAAIGVTGQFSAVDGLITGEENMLLMADLHHLSRGEGRRVAAELLERFDLVEAARKPASTYSGGMKRRLDIAMTLVGNPRIIFLDEPTTGLDPRSRHTMWQIIRELVTGGVTVFLTTQYLEEAVSVVLVGAVAVAIGFRSTGATALEWLAAFGLLVLFALALTWIAVGMGLISPNAEAASNNAMPLILLPLLSSAFTPVASMPGWFEPIAEYQPFTPAIETLRGLLLGSEIGHNGWLAVAWCLGLAVLGYFWSTAKFNRDPK